MQTVQHMISHHLRDRLELTKKSLLGIISKENTERTVYGNAVSIIDSINVILKNGTISKKYAKSLLNDTDESMFVIHLATTNIGKVTEVSNYCEYNQIGSALKNIFLVNYPMIKVDVEESKLTFAGNARTKSEFYSKIPDLENQFVMADDSGIIVNAFANVLQEYKDLLSEEPLTNLDEIATLTANLDELSGSTNGSVPFLPGVVSARFASAEIVGPFKDVLDLEPLDRDEIERSTSREDVINNIVVLDALSIITADPENFEAVYLSTGSMHSTISISQNGKELAKGAGTLPGMIKDPTGGITINDIAALTEFGYNPIFYVPEKNQFLGDIHNRVRSQFDHRSQAISSAFADLMYRLAFDEE